MMVPNTDLLRAVTDHDASGRLRPGAGRSIQRSIRRSIQQPSQPHTTSPQPAPASLRRWTLAGLRATEPKLA